MINKADIFKGENISVFLTHINSFSSILKTRKRICQFFAFFVILKKKKKESFCLFACPLLFVSFPFISFLFYSSLFLLFFFFSTSTLKTELCQGHSREAGHRTRPGQGGPHFNICWVVLTELALSSTYGNLTLYSRSLLCKTFLATILGFLTTSMACLSFLFSCGHATL